MNKKLVYLAAVVSTLLFVLLLMSFVSLCNNITPRVEPTESSETQVVPEPVTDDNTPIIRATIIKSFEDIAPDGVVDVRDVVVDSKGDGVYHVTFKLVYSEEVFDILKVVDINKLDWDTDDNMYYTYINVEYGGELVTMKTVFYIINKGEGWI